MTTITEDAELLVGKKKPYVWVWAHTGERVDDDTFIPDIKED